MGKESVYGNRSTGNKTQRKMLNRMQETDSKNFYSWEQDPINLARAKAATGKDNYNPFAFTGGDSNTGDYEGTNFNNALGKWDFSTNNQYGGDKLSRMSQSGIYPGGFNQSSMNPNPGSFGNSSGMLGKIGNYIGDNPMDVANLGLNIWGQVNQNKALNQNEQYLGDVRKAMEFDQADVNRRWDLAMGDYKVRQEDQNQTRTAQGMKNPYANVGHESV